MRGLQVSCAESESNAFVFVPDGGQAVLVDSLNDSDKASGWQCRDTEKKNNAIFFLSGIENSKMFPKEARPPYLQDDSYFNKFKPEVALQAVMAWGQTSALEKANQLKEQKVEKGTNMRKNTAVKMVEVKEGKDDATTVFHPQRFLRPPVVGLDKYWSLFPKKWEEKYYSVYMEDVGLQNDLGRR